MLGVGNSSYKFFCGGAQKVEDQLRKVGATSLMDRINADELGDQAGKLYLFIRRFVDLAIDIDLIRPQKYKEITEELSKAGKLTDFEVSYDIPSHSGHIQGQVLDAYTKNIHSSIDYSSLSYPPQVTQNLKLDPQQELDGDIIADIISVEELLDSPDSGRSTSLVKFRIHDAPKKYHFKERRYQAGDHLVVYAMNDQELVEQIAHFVGVEDLDKPFTYLKDGKPLTEDEADLVPFPLPITFRYALSAYFDITSPPTQKLFTACFEFAQDDEEQVHLHDIAEDPKAYFKFLQSHYPTLLTVFQQFPSIKLTPYDFLSKIVPELLVLRGRSYSISSSPLMEPEECHLTMSLHTWKASDNDKRLGLTTGYITRLAQGCQVRVHIREAAATHLHEDNTRPIILVGAGSGMAPLRAYWQERQFLQDNCSDEKERANIGDAVLLYGCRNEADYLYQEEIEEAQKDGVLLDVFISFSRRKGTPKKYVHQLVHDNAARLTDMINTDKCHIFVCGAERMGVGVIQAFRIICDEHSAQCKDILDRMTLDGRYAEDVFTETSLVGENIETIEIAKEQETKKVEIHKTLNQTLVGNEMEKLGNFFESIENAGEEQINTPMRSESEMKHMERVQTEDAINLPNSPLASRLKRIKCGSLSRLRGAPGEWVKWVNAYYKIEHGQFFNAYSNELDEFPIGSIELSKIREVVRYSSREKANQFTVILETSVREIYLRARTKLECDRWIFSIRERMKKHFTFDVPPPLVEEK